MATQCLIWKHSNSFGLSAETVCHGFAGKYHNNFRSTNVGSYYCCREHWVKFACISFLAVALPNKWHTASVYNVDIVEAVGVESGAWEFLILVLILI